MNGLYRRLAVTNLKSNRQFYLPYILVGILSVMLFYSLRAIQENEGVLQMRGASVLYIVLTMGIIIIGVCVCIFLFYTNSFVMKRRRKELGVFNILGMEKKHIARVLVWEAFILYIISVTGGLAFGIVINKLLTMFLYKLTGLAEKIPFYISGKGCIETAQLFAVMYLIMLIYNFMQVRLASPVALLHSSNTGEREPKAKWIHALIGIICIFTGYYLAVSVRELMTAINMFFIAVLLVIAGTYEIFMSGSIAFLKLLRKNKKYYYNTKHFITVSGMLYRMKQNAVGLANICILSTMVMVIVSTTVCMYAGLEDTLSNEKDLELSFYYNEMPDELSCSYIFEQIGNAVTEQGRMMTEISAFSYIPYMIYREENAIALYDSDKEQNRSHVGMLKIFTKEEFEKYAGQELPDVDLQNSILIASIPHIETDTLEVFGQSWHVSDCLDYSNYDEDILSKIVSDIMIIIVEDVDVLEQIQHGIYERKAQPVYEMAMELDGTWTEKKQCAETVHDVIQGCQEQGGYDSFIMVSTAHQRDNYLELNGGFFFLGLFLGTMFLVVTVLIIYYKQISEGYEDRERFAIMIKVGMGHHEIKSAIRSQVRTIFFFPITVAVLHLIAAFPMLKLLLLIFHIGNTVLFIWCLAGTVLIFLALYFAVFWYTSQSYYKIVYR